MGNIKPINKYRLRWFFLFISFNTRVYIPKLHGLYIGLHVSLHYNSSTGLNRLSATEMKWIRATHFTLSKQQLLFLYKKASIQLSVSKDM